MEALYGTGVATEEIEGLDRAAIVAEFLDDALDVYAEREAEINAVQEGMMRDVERFVVLQIVDVRWREHLEAMDYMREGIYLRSMAQKDPLIEYRNEGHLMFLELSRAIRREVVGVLFHLQVEPGEGGPSPSGPETLAPDGGNGNGNGQLSYQHDIYSGSAALAAAGAPDPQSQGAVVASPTQLVKSEHELVGRNDPCWCGSGKKFKRCHGA
jgi:preprotein translocase subunit SecA